MYKGFIQNKKKGSLATVTAADVFVVEKPKATEGGGGGSTENIPAGAFTGVLNISGGNRYYDDYTSGAVVNPSLSATKVLGATATVRVKGGLLGLIPTDWSFSGQPKSSNANELNELSLLYVKSNDVRIVNRVVALVDNEDPTTPTNLNSPTKTDTTVDLAWTASTDNNEVIGYNIYVGGVYNKQVVGTTGTVTGLSNATQYSFTVSAIDASANESAQSAPLLVTTASPQFVSVVDWEQEVYAIDQGAGTLILDVANAPATGGYTAGGFGSQAISGNNAFKFTAKKNSNSGTRVGLRNTSGTLAATTTWDAYVSVSVANTFTYYEKGTVKYTDQSFIYDSEIIFRLTDGVMTIQKDGVTVYTSDAVFPLPLTPVAALSISLKESEVTNAVFENTDNLVISPI